MLRTVLVGSSRTIPATMRETNSMVSATMLPAYEKGTTDYDEIANKPTINGVTLEGEMSLSDIGLVEAESTDIDSLFQEK